MARLRLVLEVVGKGRPQRRIRRHEELIPVEALAGQAERRALRVGEGRFDRKQQARLAQRCRADLAQRRIVVKHVETAAESCRDQIILPSLNGQIAHLDGRHAALELDPALALIGAEVEAEFGTGKKQRALHMILDQRVNTAALGQAGGDRTPALAKISTAQQIGLEITILVIVEGGIHGVGSVLREQHARHVGALGHTREAVDLAPAVATIGGNLDQSIIGANRQQAFGHAALVQCHDVAVEGGRGVLGHRIHTPDTAHHLELIAVDLSGQIAADRRP